MPKKYRITLIIAGLIVAYLGFIYFSRWSDRQVLRQTLEERKAEQDRPLAAVYGEGSITIISFYTTAPTIRRGETAQLCYGVSSAEKVRSEPPVKNVWPAISRCVDVSPESDTVYKLIAEDAEGNIKTAEATIKVLKQ